MNFPGEQELLTATEAALRAVDATRFFATERGFHGRFYCALQTELDRCGYFTGGLILEMEYQKSARHGTWQRPDIVLHVRAEASGTGPSENNVAAWALKRKATPAQAKKDFEHLDDLFATLRYPLGYFVNVDSTDPMLRHYKGEHRAKVQAVAAWQSEGRVQVCWAANEA